MTCRCRECGRLLLTDASRAAGIGPTCAARSRVSCGRGVDERQVAIAWDAPWLAEGFSAAQWPEVLRLRALSAGDPRHVEGCPGCGWFGVCAWHATGEPGREMRCVVEDVSAPESTRASVS